MFCGIFVGGRGTRMGGVAKGLLPIEGEPIVARTSRLARELGLEVVLVGEASAYAHLGIASIADDPPGIGPLGGLHALLALVGGGDAVVLGCDMPHVRLADLAELARFSPGAEVVAARRSEGAPWEPLFSRWSHRTRPRVGAAIDEGIRSFQKLMSRFQVERVPVAEASLADWDEPGDLAR